MKVQFISSFLGHSLVAYSFFSADQRKSPSPFFRLMWLGWLIVLASAPDVDYLISALRSPAHHGVRITHSISLSLILPLCTVVTLFLVDSLKSQRKVLSLCAVLTGLSHLVLDFLVRVTPLPLFWPLNTSTFTSSIGILPSAGRIQISNYNFYRNLLIEVGILAPILYFAKESYDGKISVENRARLIVLLLISGCFMMWSISLTR